MSMEAGKPDAGTSAGPGTSAGGNAGEPGQKARTGGRRSIIGKVHSAKMQKTRTVRVVRLERHAKYGKFVRSSTTYYAHDEGEVSHEGDTVLLMETRPLSRTKRWRVVKVLTEGHGDVAQSLADTMAIEGVVGASSGGRKANEGGDET